MLFTTKQLLEGSRKVMRIGLNNPDSLGGKEKNKVSL
jgi:hypothetical protein